MIHTIVSFVKKLENGALELLRPDDIVTQHMKAFPFIDFLTMFICIISYYVMAFVGPKIMKNVSDKPLNMFAAKFLYNLIQIIVSSYMLIQSLFLVQKYGLSFGSCIAKVNHEELAKLCWIWYMKKFLDLFDTIFLVLEKKKVNAAYQLQIFHHSKAILFTWLRLHSSFDAGILVLFILISMEHLIIFLYLFASMHSIDPSTGQSFGVWWKKELLLAKLFLLLLLIAHTSTLISCPRKNLHIALILAVLPNVHFLLTELVSTVGGTAKTKKG
mmetsp:Transcript_21819/g.31298  ORF Transcript_21819/g.31298 Transcript_21819/m.31298 type:complete len:272 (-) Transcript_21819:135-950(-)